LAQSEAQSLKAENLANWALLPSAAHHARWTSKLTSSSQDWMTRFCIPDSSALPTSL